MMKLNSMLEIQMKRSQGNSTFCGLNSQDSGDFSFHQISSHTSETDDLIKGPNSDCIFVRQLFTLCLFHVTKLILECRWTNT